MCLRAAVSALACQLSVQLSTRTLTPACSRLPPLQVPTPEALAIAGISQAEVGRLGPGTLLVLALPAWYGQLYSSGER
jgi:hypothetical protein